VKFLRFIENYPRGRFCRFVLVILFAFSWESGQPTRQIAELMKGGQPSTVGLRHRPAPLARGMPNLSQPA
jgi:hypothetical protein